MTRKEFIKQAMVAMCANPHYTNIDGLKCGEIAHDAERLARVAEQVFESENIWES